MKSCNFDLAPDYRRWAAPAGKMRPIHQLRGGARPGLDLGQAFARLLVELLVVHQQTEVAVEEREDVIHPMREAANELVLKIRLFNLHLGQN